MTRRALILVPFIVPAAWLFAARSEYVSIKQKFDGIENYRFKPGSRISINDRELNAYVQTELPKVAPPSTIRSPEVQLNGNNMATGRALINFVALRKAQGKATSWWLRKLLDGEHEVAVTAEVQSGNGTATVYPRRVEIEGIPIEGAALDFVIQNYLVPNYPDAKIGRPFPLHYNMDRFEVKPGRVDVVMKNQVNATASNRR